MRDCKASMVTCVSCLEQVQRRYALWDFREQPSCFKCIFDFTINGQVIRIRED